MNKKIIILLLVSILLIILFTQVNFDSKKDKKIYNTSTLEKYISNDLNENPEIIIINGKKYYDKDIRLRQYFYGEINDVSYDEVINTIIFSDEAKKREIEIEDDIKSEIINRVNNYNFTNEFLKKIDYEEQSLKEKMIECLTEIEEKRYLIDEINQEIVNNNITIEDKELKEETQELYDFYLSIKNDTNNKITENDLNIIFEEYIEKVNLIKDKYLEKIKEDVEVEYSNQ